MVWILAYLAAGVVFAGFAEADEANAWVWCLLLWPAVLLYTLGQTIGSYFK